MRAFSGLARATLGVIAMLLLLALWTVLPRRIRRSAERLVWAVLRAGFGLRVRCHGAPLRAPGTLFVANHVSWTDIVVLGGLLDAGFVAKAEVARWPVIGAGARRLGCLFVARDRPGQAGKQSHALAELLSGGDSLILFPEGTTGDGRGVLPFRSSLFAGAVMIQPVTLSWRRHDGAAFDAGQRRLFAWLGDDELLPHAVQLARSGGALVDVFFEEPVQEPDRKAVAQACQAAIAARLAGIAAADQAATLNRAA